MEPEHVSAKFSGCPYRLRVSDKFYNLPSSYSICWGDESREDTRDVVWRKIDAKTKQKKKLIALDKYATRQQFSVTVTPINFRASTTR